MYRLNEERIAQARPILEKYRAQLHTTGKFIAEEIQRDPRKCWKATSRDVEDIFLRLVQNRPLQVSRGLLHGTSRRGFTTSHGVLAHTVRALRDPVLPKPNMGT